MLYKKSSTPRLEPELFKNPTSEYRGTPFWAWNSKLEQKELEWQLENFKKMGFGGAHMHVRTGMATPYLSDEHLSLVKACVEKAKKEDMLAWLYDEDRWPSGAAGGIVTKEEKYRGRYLLFTPTPYHPEGITLEEIPASGLIRSEDGKLLACYDVELDEEGYLTGWKVIGEDEPAEHEKWYAYLEVLKCTPWYNNQAYINTLDKEAMDKFIEVTYEAYNRTISEEFDNTVPAIFTDEPQFMHKGTLKFAKEKKDVFLPWTDDLAKTYAEVYNGEDLLAGLPELFWDYADGRVSVIRYHYHDHVCERFAQAFADNCGKWCDEHGLALTGHMFTEPTLSSQTSGIGEAMRSYRGFGLPGIDMLCALWEYTTAKQAQSAVHQFGREGMTSELYGVTNWDFDFRGHKLHGDWQAALGVTIRVPHLSWVSMGGSAKRDYPASISYQSPWWEQYSRVEDHFARTNTALTRGKPIVKVGVIHPIESYWLHWGPEEQIALVRKNLDDNFQNITKWLLFGGIDFDFISESLLPELCGEASAPLKVGAMEYDVILVPGCETLRSTTLERLESFAAAGGRLIFAGELPTLENARPSDRGAALAAAAERISFSQGALLQALEPVRLVELRDAGGAFTENLLYNMRQDGDGRWLFIAHGTEPYNKDVSRFQDLRIRLKGRWKITVYNTQNGEVEDIEQKLAENMTECFRRLYDYDSLLLWLEPVEVESEGTEAVICDGVAAVECAGTEAVACEGAVGDKSGACKNTVVDKPTKISIPARVPYTLSEPNALLLDQVEYALDDAAWQPKEEILRADDAIRRALGWEVRKENITQPWAIAEEPIEHVVHFRWRIISDLEYTGAKLAIETPEVMTLRWNSTEIENTPDGWYADKAIKTIVLPDLKAGENILEADIPYGKRTELEWAYLLGDFGVEVCGSYVHIVEARKELAFGNIASQGLPFYGGNITYHIPVETEGGDLLIRSSQYRGVLQTVSVDGGEEISVIYPPYTVKCGDVKAGKHTVDICLFGHRRNGFGPVHLTDLEDHWISPDRWRSKGERWTYDYKICEEGIMTTPEIMEG